MSPQANHPFGRKDRAAVSHQHPLHHLGHITDVEQIVELLRSGQEVRRHGLVHVERGGGDADRQLLDLVIELD
eukprot:CAMPEP_0185000966 /NCGR_PEP_ID=MMETSP1098-20130426/69748_1 /TAXON_ID=89044 /ORGANISM="Spumella elongata, Strain CCAP 955/1" /LENGTH=72 /DNA_ID=CAMNT_0027528213 /DNA_START=18 /DNA_END=233 /DNA_ORIENTATION=-